MDEVEKVYKMREIVAESQRSNIECFVEELRAEMSKYFGYSDFSNVIESLIQTYKADGRFK